MSSSSSDAPVNFQQHTLDYYKSTADDDAAIVEANREARREETRRKKDEKKFRKMFGISIS
jgi:splicing factor 45